MFEVSPFYVKRKWNYHADTAQSFKSEFDLYLLDFDSKNHRGPPWVMNNVSIKYHDFVSIGDGSIVQKWCKLQSTNLTLTLAVWPHYQYGSSSGHLQYMCKVSSLYVKRKWSYRAETTFPQTDRQTDRQSWCKNRQTDRVTDQWKRL